ncbi:MAG: hypothetical protein GY869_17980 [Planctomycetes bacterium]|nr:hypothetical protein [Planctomycetota bacterium]
MMIKKTWMVLLLVLALSASTYGTLVDVIIDSYDDNDLSGTITPGDEVHIKITSSVYISSIGFSLQVNGSGALAERGATIDERIAHHDDFAVWFPYPNDLVIDANSIEDLAGGSFIDIPPPADLVWNLKIICGDPGSINVDLQLKSMSMYKNDPGDVDYSFMTEEDLGDLTLEVLQAPPGKVLTVEVIGGHGTVDPSQGEFPEGLQVQLTAIPETGYRLKQWIGANDKTSLLNTNTITMIKDQTVKVKFEPTPADQVTKALFKAGKTRAAQTDSFLILGALSASQQDILDANEITIMVGTNADPDLFTDSFNVNDDGFNLLGHQAGFKFKGPDGSIKKLDVNVKNGKFVLMATGLDLSGLKSPVRLEITFGSYQGIFTIEEDVINNQNKSIPPQYLLGVEDMLNTEKTKVRTSQGTGVVTVTIQGTISVDETNLDLSANNVTVLITWGDFNETIPAVAGAITAKKGKFTYKKPKGADLHYVTSAVFDLQKGTFKITIKKEGLDNTGAVSFGIQIDNGSGVVFDESENITL